jgi:hypothetical protein
MDIMKPTTVLVFKTTIVVAAKFVILTVLLVTDLLTPNVILVLKDSMPNQIPMLLV